MKLTVLLLTSIFAQHALSSVLNEFDVTRISPDSQPPPGAIISSKIFAGTQVVFVPFSQDTLNFKKGPCFLHRFPLQSRSVIRFHFSFDSAIIVDTFSWGKGRSVVSLPVFGMQNDSKFTYGVNTGLVSINLLRDKNEWRFIYHVNMPREYAGWKTKTAAPAIPGIPYVFEVLTELGQDSVARTAEVRMNGKTEWHVDVRELRFKLFEMGVVFGTESPRYLCKGRMLINHLAMGDGWLGDPPQMPVITDDLRNKSAIRNPRIRLYSPAF
jgi:hypothetical protein